MIVCQSLQLSYFPSAYITVVSLYNCTGVLDIFKSLGISCRAGSVSTNYHFEDNPGYFTQGNNAGECIGYDRIPDVIDCDVGSNVKLRRLCPCLKGRYRTLLHDTKLSNQMLHKVAQFTRYNFCLQLSHATCLRHPYDTTCVMLHSF